MAQGIRELAGLAEDMGSVSGTNMTAYSHSVPGESDTLFWVFR